MCDGWPSIRPVERLGLQESMERTSEGMPIRFRDNSCCAGDHRYSLFRMEFWTAVYYSKDNRRHSNAPFAPALGASLCNQRPKALHNAISTATMIGIGLYGIPYRA